MHHPKRWSVWLKFFQTGPPTVLLQFLLNVSDIHRALCELVVVNVLPGSPTQRCESDNHQLRLFLNHAIEVGGTKVKLLNPIVLTAIIDLKNSAPESESGFAFAQQDLRSP